MEIEQKNERGMTPLGVAAGTGNFECAMILLQAGADPKSVDEKGNTAMHLSGFPTGNAMLVKTLM